MAKINKGQVADGRSVMTIRGVAHAGAIVTSKMFDENYEKSYRIFRQLKENGFLTDFKKAKPDQLTFSDVEEEEEEPEPAPEPEPEPEPEPKPEPKPEPEPAPEPEPEPEPKPDQFTFSDKVKKSRAVRSR